jgi:hypothetical protein
MRHRSPFLIVAVPIGLYVSAMLGLALFALHPPALGWIGLGLASALAVGIGGTATMLFGCMRANADRLHPHAGPVYRLLVIVEGNARPWRLRAGVQSRVAGRPHKVYIVAPAVASLLHFLTEDGRENEETAQKRLDGTLRELGEIGIAARGTIGADDPLQAIGDALAFFPADEILIAHGDEMEGRWLEYGLERKARDLFGVHVSGLRREVAA